MKKPIDPKFLGENGIHRVPLWRIGGYALNNSATNLYMMMMGYIAYFLGGPVGVTTMVASSFSMFMRLFDGVTDPIVGMLVDKTNGKFGKNRPFMVIGNALLAVTSLILFFVTPMLPESKGPLGIRFIFFTIVSLFYYIGYTMQCIVTKSAQTCITNDPKQRPLFAVFDGVYNTFLFTIIAIVIGNVETKYATTGSKLGLADPGAWQELLPVIMVVSAIFTTIAVISIAPKDREEFYGTGNTQQKIGLKDYWDTLKNNRAIQMLVLSASSDKLASTMKTGSVTIVLYGIVAGNYGLVNGTISGITAVFGAVMLAIGVGGIATRLGQRKAMIIGSWGGIVINTLLILLWVFGDASQMVATAADGTQTFSWGFFSIAHIGLMVILSFFTGISGNIVIPMTADCADYETYRSGKYMPGLMGTLFSFVDKIISSFAPMISGALFAMVGFAERLPISSDPYTKEVHYVAVFLMFGMLIIGLACNIIAMKFYPLTKEKMEEIQGEIAAIKAKAMKG